MNAVATLPTTTPANHESRLNALVPTNLEQAFALAEIMAKADLMPAHLKGKPGDCMLIVMQAQRWGMDAMSVAQCTSVVHGKLCYEGKLVAAALYAMGAIEGRLRYEFTGSGNSRGIKVIGRPRGAGVDQTVEGTVENWKTGNEQWKKQPDDMLVYRGTRQWARRYAPEALLGVYTPDELEDAQPQAPDRVVATVVAERIEKELPPYSDDDFTKNLPTWRGLIAAGRKSAEDLIATLQTKATFTDEQLKAIREPAPAPKAEPNPDFPLDDEPGAEGQA